MKDPKVIIAVIATAFIGACALRLVWVGDVDHATYFLLGLLPSASQLPHFPPPAPAPEVKP